MLDMLGANPTWYVPGAITRFPTRNSNGIWAVMFFAGAALAAATRTVAAIVSFVVSVFIALPSFEFATASPIRTDIRHLAGPGAGARTALNTRARRADLRHLRPERFTAVNRKVHRHASPPPM